MWPNISGLFFWRIYDSIPICWGASSNPATPTEVRGKPTGGIPVGAMASGQCNTSLLFSPNYVGYQLKHLNWAQILLRKFNWAQISTSKQVIQTNNALKVAKNAQQSLSAKKLFANIYRVPCSKVTALYCITQPIAPTSTRRQFFIIIVFLQRFSWP